MTHQTVGHAGSGLRERCSGPIAQPDPSCPVEVTLAALRGRWTALVIREIAQGPRGFSDVAHALPALSDKVLADRLTQLARAGVIARRRTPSWPPRVTYTLTERGRALIPVLEALWEWGASQPAGT